jgi:hypothetical protein
MRDLVQATVAPIAARAFEGISHLRGKRALHPDGVGFEGTLRPRGEDTGAEILGGGPRPAVARLSRSVGLPEPVPEPLGIALRFPDAYGAGRHQDLLLTSTGRAPGLRHVLRPAADFTKPHYSTIAPYTLRGRRVMFGATALAAPPRGTTLDELAHRASADLRIDLLISGFRGRWRRVAVIELGDRLGDDAAEALRFDPSNTGGGLELAGAVNRLRGPAYARSQVGRKSSRQGPK